MERYIGILGLVVILGIAYAASLDRKAIKPRIIVWGLVLQFTFALFVMKIPVGMAILSGLARATNGLMNKANAGAEFIFGDLATTDSLGFRSLHSTRFLCAFASWRLCVCFWESEARTLSK